MTDQEALEIVAAVGLQVVRQVDAVDERGGVERAVAQVHDELARQRVVHDVVGKLVEVLGEVPLGRTHRLTDVRVREHREVHRWLGRGHGIEVALEAGPGRAESADADELAASIGIWSSSPGERGGRLMAFAGRKGQARLTSLNIPA